MTAWRWRNNKRESKVKCIKCGKKDTIIGEQISEKEKKSILCLEYRTGKKKPW